MRIELEAKFLPRLTRWHVRRALRWMEPADVAGVELICLRDVDPRTAKLRQQSPDVWRYTVGGSYVRRREGRGVYIILYTRDLYLGVPLLLRFTPVATLGVAFALAHEIGHHLIAQRGYIYGAGERYKPLDAYDERAEKMCDRYAFNVKVRMVKRWYFRLANRLNRLLSDWYLARGEVCWGRRDYEQAAACWYRAFRFNCNSPAADLYDKAMSKLNISGGRRLRPFTPLEISALSRHDSR